MWVCGLVRVWVCAYVTLHRVHIIIVVAATRVCEIGVGVLSVSLVRTVREKGPNETERSDLVGFADARLSTFFRPE